jgi:hypothetical protein
MEFPRLVLNGVKIAFDGPWFEPVPHSIAQFQELQSVLTKLGAQVVSVSEDPSIVIHKTQGKKKKGEGPNDGIVHVTDAWLDMLHSHQDGFLPPLQDYLAFKHEPEHIAQMNDCLHAVYTHALEEELLRKNCK